MPTQCASCGNELQPVKDENLIAATQRIHGDIFLKWLCSQCSPTNQPILVRQHLNWVDVVHLILYHLTKTSTECDHEIEGLLFFHWRTICEEIEQHWTYLWDKELASSTNSINHNGKATNNTTNNWQTSVMVTLSTYAGKRFQSGKEVKGASWTGYWSLIDVISPADLEVSVDRPLAFHLDIPEATGTPQLIQLTLSPLNRKHQLEASSNEQESKRLRREMRRLASTFVFSNLDFDRPNPPGPLTISQRPTHTAPQIQLFSSSLSLEGPCWTVTCNSDVGYCMARTSHGIDKPGLWYFEVDIEGGAVRLGVAQILAQTQGPVGFDEYSYGFCPVTQQGAIVHCGQVKKYRDVQSQSNGIGMKIFQNGDIEATRPVVGVTINVPSTDEPSPDEGICQELDINYPPLHFGQYKVRQERSQTGYISFSLDGHNLGTAFTYIYKAKYYPAISVYGGGKASFNLGPQFKYPESAAGCRAVYELASPIEL